MLVRAGARPSTRAVGDRDRLLMMQPWRVRLTGLGARGQALADATDAARAAEGATSAGGGGGSKDALRGARAKAAARTVRCQASSCQARRSGRLGRERVSTEATRPDATLGSQQTACGLLGGGGRLGAAPAGRVRAPAAGLAYIYILSRVARGADSGHMER